MQKIIKILFILSIALILSGCLHFYRPTVTQGNLLNDEAIAQLKPGMNTDQVLYLMGTPILTNTFEPERWDYVYTYRKGGHPRQQRHITLFFIGGILRDIQISPCEFVTTGR